MKYTSIFLLCTLAVIVVLGLILPAAANLLLGVGIELPRYWARLAGARRVYSYPFVLLFIGLALLTSISYTVWRIAHR
jgi:type II secretory pathway component PulF